MTYITYLVHFGFIAIVFFSISYTVEFTDIIAVREKELIIV